MKLPALKPVSTAPQACKVCGGEAPLYGLVDFNKSCAEQRGLRLPLAGVAVYYRRCRACDFLFTDAFDDWSIEEFRTHIYNDDYHIIDPDYATERPRGNADLIEKYWGELRGTLRVLDFGGGNDMLCSELRGRGFANAVTYDPMVPEHAHRPEGKFDLVTCFETIEHMPDPVGSIASIIESAADPGLIFFSTVVQPDDIGTYGMAWWYAGPRNGHVSLFSRKALAAIWARFGYKTVSFNYAVHCAFRTLPPYLAMLQGQADNSGRGPIAA